MGTRSDARKRHAEQFDAAAFLDRALNKRRVRLVVEADLDPVPGWGDNADDWQALTQRLLNDAVGHYNPAVTIAERGEQ